MSTLELLKEVRLPRWLAENKGLPRAVVIDEILQETARAVLVRVRPVIQASDHCHRCGREITNPVSLVVGYGPECCEHVGLPRPDRVTAEEMMAAAAALAPTEVWLPQSVLGLDRTSGPTTQDEPAPEETESSEARDFFRSVLPAAWPGYESREPQVQMAEAVERALLASQSLLVEAGTGTGKSFAYLVPAIQHVARTGDRVVVATGTIALQEQLMLKDIPFLQRVLPFTAELAKGKGNYLCLAKLEEEELIAAQTFLDDLDLQRLLAWARTTTTGDRSELDWEPAAWARIAADDSCTGKDCPFYDRCHFIRAKKRLETADIIVTNHALYMADLSVRRATDQAAGVLPNHGVVIFDEAHHLEEEAIKSFAEQATLAGSLRAVRRVLRSQSFSELAPENRARTEADVQKLEQALMALFSSIAERFPETGSYEIETMPSAVAVTKQLQDLAMYLQDHADQGLVFARTAEDKVAYRRDQKIAESLMRLAEVIDHVLVQPPEGTLAWVKIEQKNSQAHVTLNSTPVEVAAILRESLFSRLPAILTSATLAVAGRFDHARRRLGIDQADELIVDSPFDYRNQAAIYVPRDMPEPGRQDFNQAAAREIERILMATNGRAFVLFTSYKAMNEVYSLLAGRLKYLVLKQGDAPRSKLVERFKENGQAVLFATSSFWEGIDVPGAALSCVIIDRLPFAVPTDPVQKARANAIKARGGNDFVELSIPEAVIRLKQGAGRLIRTRSDRGLLAILDRRILTKPYGSTFLRSLPAMRQIYSLENVNLLLEP